VDTGALELEHFFKKSRLVVFCDFCHIWGRYMPTKLIFGTGAYTTTNGNLGVQCSWPSGFAAAQSFT